MPRPRSDSVLPTIILPQKAIASRPARQEIRLFPLEGPAAGLDPGFGLARAATRGLADERRRAPEVERHQRAEQVLAVPDPDAGADRQSGDGPRPQRARAARPPAG